MAPALVITPRRRSPRLARRKSIDESKKRTASVSPQRNTGQLRLPTPPSAKARVQRTRMASYSPKSKRRIPCSLKIDLKKSPERGRWSKVTGSSGSHGSQTPEISCAISRNGLCSFCSPESSPERCAHRRGRVMPDPDTSILGPDTILASVETDDVTASQHNFEHHKHSGWEKRTNAQKQRKLNGMLEAVRPVAGEKLPLHDSWPEGIPALDRSQGTPSAQRPDRCAAVDCGDMNWENETAVSSPERFALSPVTEPESLSTLETGARDGTDSYPVHMHQTKTEPQHCDKDAKWRNQIEIPMDDQDSKITPPRPTLTDWSTASSDDMATRSSVYSSEMTLWQNWVTLEDLALPGIIAPPPSPDMGPWNLGNLVIEPLSL